MCFLRVHGPDLALAFYRDALVLDLRNDVAHEGFRWIIVDAAYQPGVAIVLTNYQNGIPATARQSPSSSPKGALTPSTPPRRTSTPPSTT